jgi:predicted porin
MNDKFDVLGIGVKHIAIPNKFDIGADLTVTRSRSDIAVDNVLGAPPFPTAKTSMESFKLYGTYSLKDNLSITGSYQYEHYDGQDWRLDGIGPATVPGLLALGVQPPNYSLSVFRVALRYRF